MARSIELVRKKGVDIKIVGAMYDTVYSQEMPHQK